eukprot:g24496.t1
MAEEMNNYFASVFTMEDTSNILKIRESGAELNMVAIIEEKVLEKQNGLKVDRSLGPDGLHPRVLKEIAEEIVEALVMIFQESLESGSVPEDWKIANVTPLFKKRLRQKTENYRPISLILVVGKTLESIVKDEISEYLEMRGTDGILATFAGDTKIGRGTGCTEDAGKLQKDLDSLGEWTKMWQLEYNVGKCEVMYFGKRNRGMDYFLNGEKVQKSEVQRDLGFLVQDFFK